MPGPLKAFEFIDHMESQISLCRKFIEQASTFPKVNESDLERFEQDVDDLERQIIDIEIGELSFQRIDELNYLSGRLHTSILALSQQFINP